jgi:hypothetical protein
MPSLRTLLESRAVKIFAPLLGVLGLLGMTLPLLVRLFTGRGLEPYFTGRGIQTTPVQALVTLVVSVSVIVVALVAARLRLRKTQGSRHRRARSPVRARAKESRFLS